VQRIREEARRPSDLISRTSSLVLQFLTPSCAREVNLSEDIRRTIERMLLQCSADSLAASDTCRSSACGTIISTSVLSNSSINVSDSGDSSLLDACSCASLLRALECAQNGDDISDYNSINRSICTQHHAHSQ
jgi:hypothetical protein